MLAQSAVHEASGQGHAALGPEGLKAGKKAKNLLEGLFASLLAKAEGAPGARRGEGSKNQLLVSSKGAVHGSQAADKAKKPDLAAKSILGTYASGNPKAASAPKPGDAEEASASVAAKDRKKADKKALGQSDELTIADLSAARPAEDRKPAKSRAEAAADEIAAAKLGAKGAKSPAPDLSGLEAAAKANASEAEAKEDEKKKDKAKSETKVSVLDLRRASESKRDPAAKASKEEPKTEELSAKDSPREGRVGSTSREVVRDLAFDPLQARESKPGSKSDAGAQIARGQDFQSLLAQRMGESWNGEIVKSAHIVLRDGDAGTIRLRLKPESLGNVKIELNLADNNISGRILVESDEAKTAFERNMNQLADAFTQGGFDSARLEVAVGGGSQQGTSGQGAGDSRGPFYSERLRSAVGSIADPATAGAAYARRGGAVDILA